MSEQHPEDLPWNDVPADDEALPGTIEPDPAEVMGDAENARDLSSPPQPGEGESLEERLAEEEPDTPQRPDTAEDAPELMAGEEGEEDVAEGEPDSYDPAEAEERAAEDAAMHITENP
ncbi:MAG TPA: hypothetical protein VJU79_10875 [Candidatus Dormibacteraeota bacterium]|nr:hypothetical protein [Candidatus Dormibacteraeota bacterium]